MSYGEQPSMAELKETKDINRTPFDTQEIPTGDDSGMYKSFWSIFFYNIAGFAGFLYYGYCLVYVSCVPIQQQMIQYKINMTVTNATTLLSALIPVGGLIGAFLCVPLVPIISRRHLMLYISIVSLIGAGLIQIPNFPCLIIGKIIQGICAGAEVSLAPLFISEMSPKCLKGIMGNINLSLLAFGIIISQCLYFMMDFYNPLSKVVVNQLYRIIFGFPIVFSILRFIIFIIYRNQTPPYLLQQGKINEARELIAELYKPEYVDNILTMLQNDLKISKDAESTGPQKTLKLRVFIGSLLNLNQQFSGINVISLYGSSLCEIAVPGYGNVLQIFLMFVEMLGCYICIFLISRIGRRPLIHFGTIVSIITNVVTGIGYLPHFYVNNALSLGQIIPLMIMLFVYMLVYGASLGPITFSYVPQMTPPKYVPIPVAANWIGAIITIVIFPIISAEISNAYLFFILTGLIIIGAILNWRFLIQTKDKSQKQIEQQLEQKML